MHGALCNIFVRFSQHIHPRFQGCWVICARHVIAMVSSRPLHHELPLREKACPLLFSLCRSLMAGVLASVQKILLPRLPVGSALGMHWLQPKSALVAALFFTLSLRSRVFSPLDNSRPAASKNDPVFRDRKRPSWQPPLVAFPIIWSTISILRTVSSFLVWKTTGTLICPAILIFAAHLAIGNLNPRNLTTCFYELYLIYLTGCLI
jgi:hypothetical protein